MAVYNKGNETKRRFIMLTYKMLLDHDASELKVRDIAEQMGCSVAALYRHFDSLEYLIVLTSVKFLDEYMEEYGKLLDSDRDLIDLYLTGWKLFNKYAFQRPDVYYRLFWGQYNTVFESAVQEYFELFPISKSDKYPAYFYTLLFNNNIQERDFLMLRRAVNRGLLTDEDAEYFSKTSPLIVMGMLIQHMNASPEERRQAELDCNSLLEKNLGRLAQTT